MAKPFDWKVVSYTDEEAEQVCVEHRQSSCVLDAHPVTFGGKTHVHLDLDDGDIVVVSKEVCLHIEW
jgi:hypothetical protein